MEPNQNPTSERDWSIEEREEFFASQDAMTLDFNSIPKQSPIQWSTSAWNGPLIELDPNDPFGDMERIFNRGIHVTSIVPPEQGWIVAAHCCLCKVTFFVLSPWAVKPEKGDYIQLKGTCLDEELHIKHNLWPQHDYPWPSRMGPRPEEWTEEAYKYYWNSMGVPK
jgi:hypothetical protein